MLNLNLKWKACSYLTDNGSYEHVGPTSGFDFISFRVFW